MAADSSQATHRPGAFKQQNKSHKTGRHRSKGQLQKEAKGRVNVKFATKKLKSSLQRQERRNQAQQIRKHKREDTLNKKRGRGGPSSPPFIVAVVQLCEGLDPEAALELIKTCDEEANVVINDMGTCHISVPRFKQRFSFICPEYGNLYGMLDAAKVADTILFLVSPEFGVDRYGEYCLSCLFAQGMPSPLLAIQGLNTVPVKKQGDAKKMVQKKLEKRFPGEKYHSIDSSQDAMLVLRTVGGQKINTITFRERRPHILAEQVSFELSEENSLTGTLKVSGYIRGRPLRANGLIHLPGWDSYQMIQIDGPDDPYTLHTRSSKSHKGNNTDSMAGTESMEADVKVLDVANPNLQESLQSEVIPDPLEGEQTWPTEEELAQAEEDYKQKKIVKRVPKGTSDYQAAWIVDTHELSGEESDDMEDDEDDDDDDDEAMSDDDSMSEDDADLVSVETTSSRRVTFSTPSEMADDEYESITMDGEDAKYDATIDVNEERKFLEKMKEARQNEMFPDEVDTPKDSSAKVRFQRYRGLMSFRTTPWDPKENLPTDYSRIYQFDNYRHTKKRVLSANCDAGALPGWYVTVHVANVPKEFMETYHPGAPVVLFGLMPHEQKMSVMHFLLKRPPTSQQPIKSKERMIFHCGFRRFSACPVYSQHTNGNKHKLERFLQDVTVATVYAPIMFPPSPVLMFKDRGFGHQDLVATGSILPVNPDRVIVKRLVISGHPFKINKKSTVVRYMFFTREDIMWFKPVELRTKWGRRGHIKEPLGTHGHMKCVFDGQLKSQDTVLMNLYKRIYPKWTFVPRVLPPGSSTYAPSLITTTEEDMMDEFFD